MGLRRIIRKELKTAVRNRQVLVFGLLVVGLLLAATTVGFMQYRHQQARIERAQQQRRAEWLGQGEKHPHIATHFGTFVFKPKTALSFFDYGLDAYTGSSVYLEAHYQHEYMFRPAQDSGGMIRFGELSGALVLQVLLPLLIIFLAFGAFTQERERGTLRLLFSQGVTLQTLAWGKVWAYFGLVLFMVIPTLTVVMGGAFAGSNQPLTSDLVWRLVGLSMGYGAYFFGFVCFCVLVSAWSASSRNALLTLLLAWITFTILLPKTTATVGDALLSLPTMQAFQEAVSHDTDAGLPGDGPKAERKAKLLKTYLTRYQTDSVQHLPLNFEWVAAQQAEAYQDRVQAQHRARLIAQLETQNRVSIVACLVDPYLAIRDLGMALCGTDLYTNLDFQRQASAYRGYFIGQLNDNAAHHSRYGEFYEYHTGGSLWASVRDFSYRPPALKAILGHYTLEGMALLLWCLGLPLLLRFTLNRLPL